MMELLPDLPGTITGIKCKDPFIVPGPVWWDDPNTSRNVRRAGLTHTKTPCRLPVIA